MAWPFPLILLQQPCVEQDTGYRLTENWEAAVQDLFTRVQALSAAHSPVLAPLAVTRQQFQVPLVDQGTAWRLTRTWGDLWRRLVARVQALAVTFAVPRQWPQLPVVLATLVMTMTWQYYVRRMIDTIAAL